MKLLNLLKITTQKNLFSLTPHENNKNHVDSVHAAAQFALAETSSGYFLTQKFPHLVNKVIPLLRESKVKFKSLATSKLTPYPECDNKTLEKFEEQFQKKQRATITIKVDLKDGNEKITCSGEFTWYIQII